MARASCAGTSDVSGSSCVGQCGSTVAVGNCYCSIDCLLCGDCYADYFTACGGI